MKRHLSFAQYRRVDLALFAAILIVSEYLIGSAATRWFPGQLFTVSAAAAVSAIVLMRWGAWAGLHAVLGGLVFCLAAGGSAQQYAIYGIGNLACLACVPILHAAGSETIRKDMLFSLLFALAVQLLMQLGRALTALVLGQELSICVGFFTTDTLSSLFTMVIIYIARNLDGVFEDQKSYLVRLQKQENAEKGGF